MSLLGMPMLILNLGGEMIYILDQVRLRLRLPPWPAPPHALPMSMPASVRAR